MMTSLKTWCLLSLSVLLLLSVAPTLSEVVQSMTQCKGFLLEDKSPVVPDILVNGDIKNKGRYKAICQTYQNVRRFVTLYDTKNRIPVLSACKFKGVTDRRPRGVSWKFEPQLEDLKKNKNMEDCGNHAVYKHQASQNDYRNTENYSRGHLFPSSYAYDRSDKESTFTLTNVVPQVQSFNEGSWNEMEECVICISQTCLRNESYILIGAKPSMKKALNNKVNIPSLMWSAFCCQSKEGEWIASAFWGYNVKGKSTLMKTLAQLHDKLSNGHSKFVAFPGTRKCPLNKTVKPEKCNCPPSA